MATNLTEPQKALLRFLEKGIQSWGILRMLFGQATISSLVRRGLIGYAPYQGYYIIKEEKQ